MTEVTCTIAECGRVVKARQLCRTHYDRWRKTGNSGGAINEWSPQSGQRCRDATCDREACKRGLCDAHYNRILQGLSKVGPIHANNRLEVVSYRAAHARIRRERGPASFHNCVDCESRAAQWSYGHLDPNEQVQDGMAYSLDVAHYEPRCVSCHKKFDGKAHRRMDGALDDVLRARS